MIQSSLAARLAGKSLLIFDLDGTLADSSPIHARAFREAFAPLGIVPDYATIAGMTTEVAVDRVLADAGIDVAADRRKALVADKRSRSLALIDRELVAIDGSVAFVRLARAKYRLALCSSGSRPAVERSIDLLGLAGMFDPVVTANDIMRGKPDPEGFLAVLARTGVAPADALVFEDADSGIEAAASAGIDAIRIGEALGWAALIEALGK